MEAIEILQSCVKVMVFLTTLFFAYRILYLYIPLFFQRKLPQKKQLRYAVLIAARNEESVIPHLLDSINTQDYPKELIDTYVVADNCTDNTAAVAQAHGATVFRRFDKHRIGKGYALQFLLDKIRTHGGWSRYDAFLIFDADNLLEPDYIRNINMLPANGYHAFCGYRNSKNFGTNWITSGYGLWYLHESSHMNRSRMALGSCCHVNGTGFGFSRELLERLDGWNFVTLTEDLEFNNYCATHGIKIGYCHDAILYDEQPITFRQSWKQRTRWAQGGFQVSVKYGWQLLKGLFHGSWQSYACFELLTISFWGLVFATVTGLLSTILLAIRLPLAEFAYSMVLSFLGAYGSLVFLAGWTLLLEWKKIYAGTWKKLLSALTFPFFIFTFLPITATALFRKHQWEPIAHTVAISSSDLSRK